MNLLQNGKADLSLAFFNDLSHAEQLSYKLTDPYLSAGFSWVRLRRDTEMQTIGTVDLLAKEATGIILPSKNTVCQTYPSFADCLTALRAGEIDAYYTYTYQAERLLYDNLRNDLTTTLTGGTVDFAIGVSQDMDVQLLSILNKGVHSLSDEEIDEATRSYTTLAEQSFSLVRLLYQYPLVMVFFVRMRCVCGGLCHPAGAGTQLPPQDGLRPAQGRGSQPSQDRVPLQYVPRYPHPHQRHYGHAGYCRSQL